MPCPLSPEPTRQNARLSRRIRSLTARAAPLTRSRAARVRAGLEMGRRGRMCRGTALSRGSEEGSVRSDASRACPGGSTAGGGGLAPGSADEALAEGRCSASPSGAARSRPSEGLCSGWDGGPGSAAVAAVAPAPSFFLRERRRRLRGGVEGCACPVSVCVDLALNLSVMDLVRA